MTSKELARLAGVSQSTVSRCLNDSPLVSEETRERVKALAREHHFAFDSAARGLRTGRTHTIGYVFSENFRSFTQNISQGTLYCEIRRKLLEQGLDLLPVFDTPAGLGEPSEALEAVVRHRRVDGLIVNRTSLPAGLREELERSGMPCIFVYDPDDSTAERFVIANNHFRSGELVGDAFGSRGLDRVVELTGSSGRPDVQKKHDGFVYGLQQHGITLEENHVLTGGYTFESGYAAVMAQPEVFRWANACFAHNDAMALGVMKALHELGVRVPEALSLIGHDDIEMASWFYPRLSTIAMNYERISSLSAEWMGELLACRSPYEGPARKVIVNGELILRETCV